MNVVLATDGSPASLAAARWVNRNLAAAQPQITVVSVAVWPDRTWWGTSGVGLFPSAGTVYTETVEELMAGARQVAEKAIRDTIAVLSDCSVTDQAILAGPPIEALLHYVHEHHPDLVVMGRRGHTAVGTLLGSVSFGVLQRGHCPILVVGDEEHHDQ